MSMFDDLDDPFPPDPANALDPVTSRIGAKRRQRRVKRIGAGAFVVSSLVAIVVATSAASTTHDRISVTTATSTLPNPVDTATTTTVTGATTTTTSAHDSGATTKPTTIAPTGAPAAGSSRDLTYLRYAFGTTVHVPSGGSAAVRYTVTNAGTWTVSLDNVPVCTRSKLLFLAAAPWPEIDLDGGQTCQTLHLGPVAPGASVEISEPLYGYLSEARSIPKRPGTYGFMPALSETDAFIRPNTSRAYYLAQVVVDPPSSPPLTVSMSAADIAGRVNALGDVDLTVTNNTNLTITVLVPVPCYEVRGLQATRCFSDSEPGGSVRRTLAPHASTTVSDHVLITDEPTVGDVQLTTEGATTILHVRAG